MESSRVRTYSSTRLSNDRKISLYPNHPKVIHTLLENKQNDPSVTWLPAAGSLSCRNVHDTCCLSVWRRFQCHKQLSGQAVTRVNQIRPLLTLLHFNSIEIVVYSASLLWHIGILCVQSIRPHQAGITCTSALPHKHYHRNLQNKETSMDILDVNFCVPYT